MTIAFQFVFSTCHRKVQENQEKLELHGTHQLLVCTDISFLGESIDTINKNTEALLYVSKEVDLEVNTGETKCKFVSYHKNAEQNHNIIIANKS
jgi:hypothetical protein